MGDPYKVLGISRTATDDEVKAAYRALAKKYHPDSYADNPLADLVEEKMKEINEAYDTIRKERAAGGSSSGASSSRGGTYGGYTGDLARVRTLIAGGRYSEAELVLDSVSSTQRGAEWHYLKGCVLLQRGAVYDAQKHIETACYMDPGNAEYRQAKESIRSYANGAGRQYRSQSSSECDMCEICSALICMNVLCNCCRG